MKIKITLFSLFGLLSTQAAMLDVVYLHGVVTPVYRNIKYVSVRDSFDQEYVLPKTLLETKTGRKIASTKGGDFKGSIYFFEISTEEYSAMQATCLKDNNKLPKAKRVSLCPPKL